MFYKQLFLIRFSLGRDMVAVIMYLCSKKTQFETFSREFTKIDTDTIMLKMLDKIQIKRSKFTKRKRAY